MVMLSGNCASWAWQGFIPAEIAGHTSLSLMTLFYKDKGELE